ncbi:MAG: TonB-dependent receptor plug domain-containing protein, partial [Sphingobium sp.]
MIRFTTATVSMIALMAFSAVTYADEPAPDADAYHDRPSQDIVVTALLARNREDILSGTSVITATELTRDLRSTIGETLAHQPGVSSSSFGPNASRPILRGFQGERVRILTDGIGSFDVSNTSADHAVAINPLTAERIEVLRGPAALLYGSSAVGGVVNVIDGRIPRAVPDEPIHIEGLATYGSAANERTLSGKAEVPLTPNLVAHVDGSWSKSGDLRTGGYILSDPLRTQARASADPAAAALADLRGDLPNSAAKSWEVAGALAYINADGDLGLAISHSDNLYGVPIRFNLTPGGEAEQ